MAERISFVASCRATTIRILISTAVLSGIGSSASAASLTTYFGIDQGDGNPPTTLVNSLSAENGFVAAFSAYGVENFDSLTLGATPTSLSFPTTSITAGFTSTDSADNYVTNGEPFGAFPTSGSQFLYSDGSGPLNDTVTFSSPVAGVGLYVTDLSDSIVPADQIELVLTLTGAGGTQNVETSVGDDNNNANVLFFGVASTDPGELVSSVQILNTDPSAGDAIGIDDLTIGTAIASTTPEPGSLVLLSTGLGGLAIVLLRRRRLCNQL